MSLNYTGSLNNYHFNHRLSTIKWLVFYQVVPQVKMMRLGKFSNQHAIKEKVVFNFVIFILYLILVDN